MPNLHCRIDSVLDNRSSYSLVLVFLEELCYFPLLSFHWNLLRVSISKKVMNRFKAKFFEVEAAEGLSKEDRRERLKVYIDNVYAALPPNVRRTMPQIREGTNTGLPII